MNALWWVLDNWFSTGLIVAAVGLITGYGPMRPMLLGMLTCIAVGVVWWLSFVAVAVLLFLWVVWPINVYLIMKEWMK